MTYLGNHKTDQENKGNKVEITLRITFATKELMKFILTPETILKEHMFDEMFQKIIL